MKFSKGTRILLLSWLVGGLLFLWLSPMFINNKAIIWTVGIAYAAFWFGLWIGHLAGMNSAKEDAKTR